MATAKTTGDGIQSTRQVLDELDALMARMLELPVSDVPADPAPTPALSASLTPWNEVVDEIVDEVVDDSTEYAEAVADRFELAAEFMPQEERPVVPSYKPVSDSPRVRAPRQPSPKPKPNAKVEEPELPRIVVVRREVTPLPEGPGLAVRSIYACNRLFDRLTLGHGGFRLFLRTSLGRTLFGLAGLALLAWALAWLGHDCLGWP